MIYVVKELPANNLKLAMELCWCNQLFNQKIINEEEYSKMKISIRKKYREMKERK